MDRPDVPASFTELGERTAAGHSSSRLESGEPHPAGSWNMKERHHAVAELAPLESQALANKGVAKAALVDAWLSETGQQP